MTTRALAILVALLALPACKGGPPLQTVVLPPANVATAVMREYDYHKEPWVLSCPPARKDFSCYGHYGVSPDAVGDAPVAVGLFHDHGAGELAGVIEGCSERINCVYRGLVVFDLAVIGTSKVVTAKLTWEATSSKHSDKTTWPAGEDCIARIGYVQSPWGGFNLSAEFLEGDVSASGTGQGVDVSVQVRKWAEASAPNHGFMLVGPMESTGHNNDDKCVTKLSTLRLRLQVDPGGS